MRTRIAVVIGVLAACGLLGCASLRSAQERVGGWFGSTPESAPEPEPAASQASPRKKAVRKPPVAAGPNATPQGVSEPAAGEPVESTEAAESSESEPEPEQQAPEQTIFDPY